MAAVPTKRSPSLVAALGASMALTLTVFAALRLLFGLALPYGWLLGILVFQLFANLLGSIWILTPLGSLFLASAGALAGFAAGVAAMARTGEGVSPMAVAAASLGGVAAMFFVLFSTRSVTRSSPRVGAESQVPPDEASSGRPVEAETAADVKVEGPDESREVKWDRPEELGEPDFDFPPPQEPPQESPMEPPQENVEELPQEPPQEAPQAGLPAGPVSPLDEEAMDYLENIFKGMVREEGAAGTPPPAEDDGVIRDVADLITDDWVDRVAEEMVRGEKPEPAAEIEKIASEMDRTVEPVEVQGPPISFKESEPAEPPAYFAAEKTGPLPVHAEAAAPLPAEEVSAGPPSRPKAAEQPESPARGKTERKLPRGPSQAPRYVIYDRMNYKRMGEYVPEGAHPRLDRLTLYRLFPEYDFKTFVIDSMRWVGDEVRIYIKGEMKGKAEGSRAQGTGESRIQRAESRRKMEKKE